MPRPPTEENEGDRPGERAIEASGHGGAGPEYLARDLKGQLYRYLLEESPLAAFDAIPLIAAHWRNREECGEHPLGSDPFWGKDPQMLVPVPWWMIYVLAVGWLRYRHRDSGVTLGEIFMIEGRGQGRKPEDRKHKQAMDERMLVLEIEDRRRREKCTVKSAIAIVAADTGIPINTLKGYRKRHGADVRSVLDGFSK